MNTRAFGQSGLKVYPICLGGNVFGWTAHEHDSFAVLDAYVAAGGNFIDTADVYSRWVSGHEGGESETILGKWMAQRKNRDKLVIATKVGMEVASGQGLTARHIRDAVVDSLRRLQTDRIDIYYAHQDDRHTPLEETMEAFDSLVREGKVRALAASNFNASRLSAALAVSDTHGWARYQGLQVVYNLAQRDVYESELEALCKREGLGVVGYYGLAAGFLSGKYVEDAPLPETPRAQGVKERYMNEAGWATLKAVRELADEVGATPSQIALVWVLNRSTMTGPIVSARNPKQLEELLGAARLEPTQEMLDRLDQASRSKLSNRHN